MTTGTLFIVAAPSGAGKTTLVGRLLADDPRVMHSISYTTRKPRPGEQNGREYNFIDVQHFLAMRERGEFAEWAEVVGSSVNLLVNITGMALAGWATLALQQVVWSRLSRPRATH